MITHSEMVEKLMKPKAVLLLEATDKGLMLQHMAIGIAGEVGELIDSIKKHTIYNQKLDMRNIIEELGDIEFYLEGLRQELGISRETTLAHNISKLSVRYEGLVYNDKASEMRKDKISE